MLASSDRLTTSKHAKICRRHFPLLAGMSTSHSGSSTGVQTMGLSYGLVFLCAKYQMPRKDGTDRKFQPQYTDYKKQHWPMYRVVPSERTNSLGPFRKATFLQ